MRLENLDQFPEQHSRKLGYLQHRPSTASPHTQLGFLEHGVLSRPLLVLRLRRAVASHVSDGICHPHRTEVRPGPRPLQWHINLHLLCHVWGQKMIQTRFGRASEFHLTTENLHPSFGGTECGRTPGRPRLDVNSPSRLVALLLSFFLPSFIPLPLLSLPLSLPSFLPLSHFPHL